MIEENIKKKSESPVFYISIPILFLMGFFITFIVAGLLVSILNPTREHWRGITDPLFLAIMNIIGAVLGGAFFSAIFTGWFYLRGYLSGLTVSKKALDRLFLIGGMISLLAIIFSLIGVVYFLDLLKSYGINTEVIDYLLLATFFLPTILCAEIGFRVAKKLSGNQ